MECITASPPTSSSSFSPPLFFFFSSFFFFFPWEGKAKAWVYNYDLRIHAYVFDKYEDQKFLVSVFTVESFEICTCYHDLKHNCLSALFTTFQVLELSCAKCDNLSFLYFKQTATLVLRRLFHETYLQ